MRASVIVAQIHRRSFRRPQPCGEFSDWAGGTFHHELGGMGLPEIFHADTEASADIADKNVT